MVRALFRRKGRAKNEPKSLRRRLRSKGWASFHALGLLVNANASPQ